MEIEEEAHEGEGDDPSAAITECERADGDGKGGKGMGEAAGVKRVAGEGLEVTGHEESDGSEGGGVGTEDAAGEPVGAGEGGDAGCELEDEVKGFDAGVSEERGEDAEEVRGYWGRVWWTIGSAACTSRGGPSA